MRFLAVTLIFVSVPAASETITLACRVEAPTRTPGDQFSQIDQVVIDDRSPSLCLRVARTMGTRAEVEFCFANRAGLTGEPPDTLQLTRRGNRITASAFRFGTPETFAADLASGRAVWAFVDDRASHAYHLTCKR